MRPYFRDALFAVLSVGALLVACLGTPDASPARVGAVIAWVVLVAAHLRLAFGEWRALVQTIGGGLLLWALDAGLALVAPVVVAGLAAIVAASRCTRRGGVIRAGAWAGAAAAVALIVPTLRASQPVLGLLSPDILAALAGGLAGGFLVVGLDPAADWLFGHVTPLTLGEFLSYDHPLLRKLSADAPGTFQHSINVGVLADAAAQAIDADALMALVGSLYHDVGKTTAPEYFFENQSGTNPHDDLPPRESARILRAHVTDGAAMVLSHRLGERVARFVREHHGTGLMRSLAENDAARSDGGDEDDFRYPGPRPASRETAVVMIADKLEATARAERPADADACLRLVRETIRSTVDEDQLAESGVSEEDLVALEPAFARAIEAMYHRRMQYRRPERPRRPSGVATLVRALRPRRARP